MLRIFNRRQRAIERANRIVGAIHNAGAKPARRFAAETEQPQPFAVRATFNYSPLAPAGQSIPSASGWLRIA